MQVNDPAGVNAVGTNAAGTNAVGTNPAGVIAEPRDATSGAIGSDEPVVDVTIIQRAERLETLVSWIVDRASTLGATSAGVKHVLALVADPDLDAVGPMATERLGALGLDGRSVTITTVERFAEAILGEFGALVGRDRETKGRLGRVLSEGDRFLLMDEAARSAELAAVLDLQTADIARDTIALYDRLHRNLIPVQDAMSWQVERLAVFEQQLDASKRPTLDQLRVREVARQRADLLSIAEEYDRLKRARGLRDRTDNRADAIALLHRVDLSALIAERHPLVAVHVPDVPDAADRTVIDAVSVRSSQLLVVRGPNAANEKPSRSSETDNSADVEPNSDLSQLLRTLRRQAPPRPTEVDGRGLGSQGDSAPPKPPRPSGASLRLVVLSDVDHEVAWVHERICAGIEAGFERSSIVAVSPDRRALRSLADRLRDSGIPVDLAAPDHRHSPVLWEMVALFRLAADPDDAVAAARVLRGPRFALTTEDLAPYADEARRSRRNERQRGGSDPIAGAGFMRGFRSPYASPTPLVAERVAEFLADVDDWAVLARARGLPTVDDRILDRHGLTLSLLSRPDADASEDLAAVHWIRSLAEVVGSWDRPGGLDALINRLVHGDSVSVRRDLDAVHLLTPEHALGLSVDHLFVLGAATPPAAGEPFWERVPGAADETTLDARSVIPSGLLPATGRPLDIIVPEVVDEHRHLAALAAQLSWERALAALVVSACRSLALTHGVWQRSSDGSPSAAPSSPELFDRFADAGLRIRTRGPQPIPSANPLSQALMTRQTTAGEVSDLEVSIRGGVSAVASHRTLDADEHAAVVEVDRIIENLAEAEYSDQLDTRDGDSVDAIGGRSSLDVIGRAAPIAPVGTIGEIELALTDADEHRRSVVIGVPEAPVGSQPRGLLFRRWLDERAVTAQQGGRTDTVDRPWSGSRQAETNALLDRIRLMSIDGEALSPQAEGDAASTFPSIGTDVELDRLADLYLTTDYAVRPPLEVLVPISLTLPANDKRPGRLLRGTVDVIHEYPDGRWEIVEVRAGTPVEAPWAALAAKALPFVARGRTLGQCRLTIIWLDEEVKIETRPCPSAEAITATINLIL